MNRWETAMNTAQEPRFGPEDLETWRRDGVALLRDFFTPEEVSAVCADFELVFGRTAGGDQPLNRKAEAEVGRFRPSQFKTFEAIPLDCSPALNLIGVHPALVAFAKQALKTDAVHLYQCQVWAKFTGDADYDQPFHCDFANHTLTAPSEEAAQNSVTVLCYFTDVTDEHGAMHYVTRPDSQPIAGPEASLRTDPGFQIRMQSDLKAHERSSASPAGTAIPYAIDVFHRGTNLTAPNGRRYAVMACFKASGDDSVGYHAWAFHQTKPWGRIFEWASPEQLACFGVPLPGEKFWTETTIGRTQARYPGWNAAPYFDRLATS